MSPTDRHDVLRAAKRSRTPEKNPDMQVKSIKFAVKTKRQKYKPYDSFISSENICHKLGYTDNKIFNQTEKQMYLNTEKLRNECFFSQIRDLFPVSDLDTWTPGH